MAYNLETASKVAYLLTLGDDRDANLRLLRLALEAVASREDVELPEKLPKIRKALDVIFAFYLELSKAKDGDNSFVKTLTKEKIHELVMSRDIAIQVESILSDLNLVADPNVKQYVENTVPDLQYIISYENLARLRQEGLDAGK